MLINNIFKNVKDRLRSTFRGDRGEAGPPGRLPPSVVQWGWHDEWNADNGEYKINNIVRDSDNGDAYICILEHGSIDTSPQYNPDCWALFCESSNNNTATRTILQPSFSSFLRSTYQSCNFGNSCNHVASIQLTSDNGYAEVYDWGYYNTNYMLRNVKVASQTINTLVQLGSADSISLFQYNHLGNLGYSFVAAGHLYVATSSSDEFDNQIWTEPFMFDISSNTGRFCGSALKYSQDECILAYYDSDNHLIKCSLCVDGEFSEAFSIAGSIILNESIQCRILNDEGETYAMMYANADEGEEALYFRNSSIVEGDLEFSSQITVVAAAVTGFSFAIINGIPSVSYMIEGSVYFMPALDIMGSSWPDNATNVLSLNVGAYTVNDKTAMYGINNGVVIVAMTEKKIYACNGDEVYSFTRPKLLVTEPTSLTANENHNNIILLPVEDNSRLVLMYYSPQHGCIRYSNTTNFENNLWESFESLNDDENIDIYNYGLYLTGLSTLTTDQICLLYLDNGEQPNVLFTKDRFQDANVMLTSDRATLM
jgi:hypothetical protein